MKPLVLIDGRLIGYRPGGIANYAEQLARHLPKFLPDYRIRVCLRRRTESPSFDATRVFTPPHHRLERITFGAEARIRGPALLHSTDYVQPIVPGVPSIVTIHDLAFLRNPSLITADSWRYYQQVTYLARRADKVIAVSEWTRSQVVELLEVSESRVAVVPNGVDHAFFTPSNAPNERSNLDGLHPDLRFVADSGDPVVLAVGTIEPRKRIDLLLDALDSLESQTNLSNGTRPWLILAGQAGWLAESTITRIRSRLRRGRTIWLRQTTNDELASLYRLSTVVAVPSADEGFGLTALEAMASGTPVLTSAHGALPEVVGSAGIIVQDDSPQAWALALASILTDYEQQRQRSIAGIESAAGYSWDRTARETASVYREVLDGR